jgi:hypothetical protein
MTIDDFDLEAPDESDGSMSNGHAIFDDSAGDGGGMIFNFYW